MTTLTIPPEYNYIGIFLTLACQLRCPWCINVQAYARGWLKRGYRPLTGREWIEALKRIPSRDDLPITLQGGEPTLHPEFYEIVNQVDKPMDILTNCQFNVKDWCRFVPRGKFRSNAPYAGIRVSYHPDQMDLMDTVDRVATLDGHGYPVGVWMIKLPGKEDEYERAKRKFEEWEIDFRPKELLGYFQGKVYGIYRYPEAIANSNQKEVECKTSELLVSPSGSVYRCHSDLYNLRPAIGDILDPDFQPTFRFRECSYFGSCVGCDIKITNNRFQRWGHTSVEIKHLRSSATSDVSASTDGRMANHQQAETQG